MMIRRTVTIRGNEQGCVLHRLFIILCFLMVLFHDTMVRADAVGDAEAWFGKVTTLHADFTQVASDGSAAEGSIVLRRPSRLKVIYENTSPLKLITTPVWLHVDQPEDRLLTSYPISETPLSLILTEPVLLRPQGYKTIVGEGIDGIIQITIKKDEGEGAGQLTLEFTESPFQLRRWIVTDVAGVKTSVTLQNMVFGQSVKNEEFRLPKYKKQ
jgi:outer membrane lipoprotein-sorting protein